MRKNSRKRHCKVCEDDDHGLDNYEEDVHDYDGDDDDYSLNDDDAAQDDYSSDEDRHDICQIFYTSIYPNI